MSNELIKKVKIGLSNEDKQKMKNEIIEELNKNYDDFEEEVKNTISGLGNLTPSGTDTEENILLFSVNKGVWVATDTGNWLYFDETQQRYVVGGVYQAKEVEDGSVTPKKTSFIKDNILYENELISFDYEGTWCRNTVQINNIKPNTTYTCLIESVSGIVEDSYTLSIRQYDSLSTSIKEEYSKEISNLVKTITTLENASYIELFFYASSATSGSGTAVFENVRFVEGNEVVIKIDDSIIATNIEDNSINNSKLQNGSVSEDKTSFIFKPSIINWFDKNSSNIINCYINNNTGNITTSTTCYASDFIPVKAGDVVRFTYTKGGFNTENCAGGYKKDKLTTQALPYATNVNDTYLEIIIPHNFEEGYIRVCSYYPLTYFRTGEDIKFMVVINQEYPSEYVEYNANNLTLNERIGLENNQIEKVKEKMIINPKNTSFIDTPNYINFFDKNSSNIIENKYVGMGGVITELNGLYIGDFIPVKNGDIIRFTCDNASYGAGGNQGCFYAEDKTTVIPAGYWEVDENKTYYTYKITSLKTAYFRPSFSYRSVDNFMVVINQEYPSDYYPYNVYNGTFNKNVLLGEEQLKQVTANVLYGKTIYGEGDSIMESRLKAGYNGGAWIKMVGDRNNMTVVNNAVSGGTIVRYDDNHCISEGIINRNIPTTADYIIFDGGVNDFATNLVLGTANLNDFTSFASDETTILGAFERICYALNTTYHNSKYGYIFNHKIYLDNREMSNIGTWKTYKEKIKEVLNKWGVPYLDLENEIPPLYQIPSLKEAYTNNGDGWHPNEEGYRKFYVDKVEAWLKTL